MPSWVSASSSRRAPGIFATLGLVTTSTRPQPRRASRAGRTHYNTLFSRRQRGEPPFARKAGKLFLSLAPRHYQRPGGHRAFRPVGVYRVGGALFQRPARPPAWSAPGRRRSPPEPPRSPGRSTPAGSPSRRGGAERPPEISGTSTVSICSCRDPPFFSFQYSLFRRPGWGCGRSCPANRCPSWGAC